ncbi:MAG: serine/threonine-protein kinase [Planctomycetota bacterium]
MNAAPRCSGCGNALDSGVRFCPVCGAEQGAETLAVGADATPTIDTRPPEPSSQSNPSSEHGRFLPGTAIGDRYRIVGRLGQGGMGEVYRADDLQLGQSVALKFLPPELVNDGSSLERLRSEVRIARGISHPNVCRVYDIAQVDGHCFLSMEYIDGEDLSHVLRRMGRPTAEKAAELAREIGLGLRAAHESGILHRDLKPANVMVDGRGRARVTDFGLAGLAEELAGARERVGTLAYMAPEQRTSGQVSVQSDLFSFGLILHELFTGRRAGEFHDPQELFATSVTRDGSGRGVEPQMEQLICRCLRFDPDDRPTTVLEVVAALPGGDPLAAALAAGEMPSPELVATAGETGVLKARTATVLFALLIAGLLLAFPLKEKRDWISRVDPPLKPEVLEARAKEWIQELGGNPEPRDSAFGFVVDAHAAQYGMSRAFGGWEFLERSPPAVLNFWYRQSARVLSAGLQGPMSQPINANFPRLQSGEERVLLDPEGRLRAYFSLPLELDSRAPERGETPDWRLIFSRAGLEFEAYAPLETVLPPYWNPPVATDRRWVWTEREADEDRPELRVEAGMNRGRLVYFRALAPWERGTFTRVGRSSFASVAAAISIALAIAVVLFGLRNHRRGLGDREGALRVAIFIGGLQLVYWALGVSRVPDALSAAPTSALLAFAVALFWGNVGWIAYLAIEPQVRRKSPHQIVAWSRLLSGRWRDPLVGRDILIGLCIGVLTWLSFGCIEYVVVTRFGVREALAPAFAYQGLTGVRETLSYLSIWTLSATINGLFLVAVPVLVQSVVRVGAAALAVSWVVFAGLLLSSTVILGDSVADAVSMILVVARATLLLVVVVRFGVLVTAAMMLSSIALTLLPGSADPSAWYTQPLITGVVVLAVLGFLGFRHSRRV